MDTEIWKDIEGFEGIYQISSMGMARTSYKRGSSNRYYISNEFYLLKNIIRNNGYYFITLRKNGIIKQCTIHRLVAETFIRNDNNFTDVNHKNGIKTDNRVENLEWCTRAHNIQHAFMTGLSCISDKQRENAMRPIEITYPNGEKVIAESVKQASKIIGYAHYNSIYKILRSGVTKDGIKLRYLTNKQYDHTPICDFILGKEQKHTQLELF